MSAGGAAGLLGGVIFWWARHGQDMTATVPGLVGVDTFGAKIGIHLLLAIVIGAGHRGISTRASPRPSVLQPNGDRLPYSDHKPMNWEATTCS